MGSWPADSLESSPGISFRFWSRPTPDQKPSALTCESPGYMRLREPAGPERLTETEVPPGTTMRPSNLGEAEEGPAVGQRLLVGGSGLREAGLALSRMRSCNPPRTSPPRTCLAHRRARRRLSAHPPKNTRAQRPSSSNRAGPSAERTQRKRSGLKLSSTSALPSCATSITASSARAGASVTAAWAAIT
jgi:hypothetical protein